VKRSTGIARSRCHIAARRPALLCCFPPVMGTHHQAAAPGLHPARAGNPWKGRSNHARQLLLHFGRCEAWENPVATLQLLENGLQCGRRGSQRCGCLIMFDCTDILVICAAGVPAALSKSCCAAVGLPQLCRWIQRMHRTQELLACCCTGLPH
jgi:hypothetical protein